MKLIENPIIRAKFVKMGRMIEPAFAFLEQLTWLIELSRKTGRKDAVRIGGMTAMLKVVSTRCLEKCVREAQQVLGGLGYAKGGKGGRFVTFFFSSSSSLLLLSHLHTYLIGCSLFALATC